MVKNISKYRLEHLHIAFVHMRKHVHISVLYMPKQVLQCTSTITHLPCHINTSRELFPNQLTGICTMVYVPWYMYHGICTMVYVPWYMYHGICTMVKNMSKNRLEHLHIAFVHMPKHTQISPQPLLTLSYKYKL